MFSSQPPLIFNFLAFLDSEMSKVPTISWNTSSASVKPVWNRSDKENVVPKYNAKDQPRTAKGKPSSCVFVASLRSSRSDDSLCRSVTKHFEEFGPLVSVKVLRDPANRPYAFVQYTNDHDCKLAIELAHNSIMDGRKLRCEAAKVNRTLFVTALREVTLAQMQEMTSLYGETDLLIASNRNGKALKEVQPDEAAMNWYVKFTYRDDAIRAFATLTDHSDYTVEWAQNIDDVELKTCQIDKCSIYVSQLSSRVEEKDIVDRFSSHGVIRYVNIVHRGPSSFAFVTYEEEPAAASAVSRENHTMFMNRTILVKYKEFSNKPPSKMIISSQVPVVLAPPPIHLKKKILEKAKYPLERQRFENRLGPLELANSHNKSYGYRRESFGSKDYERDYSASAPPRRRMEPKSNLLNLNHRYASDSRSSYYFVPSTERPSSREIY